MGDSAAMPQIIPAGGKVEPPFEAVAEVFARTVARQGVGGAELCVYRDGRPVVDLVGGTARQDSLTRVFSVSKLAAAVAAMILHGDGRLDLDEPVSSYWPEFRRASTASITARMVLSHRSGLSAVARPMSLPELVKGALEDEVARQEPYWEPGSAHGYAAFTFGALLDGIFRRTVGTDVASVVAQRIAGPLDLDMRLGASAADLDRLQRVEFEAPVLTPAQARWMASGHYVPDGSFAELQTNPEGFLNSPEAVGASWPAMSLVSSARDLARFLAATIGEVAGTRLLGGEALAVMTASCSKGLDRMLGHDTHFGLGVELPHAQLPLLGGRSFGHEGAGGSMAFADPERGIAVAFTTTAFPCVIGASDQALLLAAAIRHCLTYDA